MTRLTDPDSPTYNFINTHTHVTNIIDPFSAGPMRAAYNDKDDGAGLRDYVQFNKDKHM